MAVVDWISYFIGRHLVREAKCNDKNAKAGRKKMEHRDDRNEKKGKKGSGMVKNKCLKKKRKIRNEKKKRNEKEKKKNLKVECRKKKI